MVLSNKKLKQKLRAARAESLTETVSGGPDPSYKNVKSANPDPNSELRQLLAAAIQRPRLSKREKRRKTLSLQGSELNSAKNTSNVEEKKKAEGREEGDLVGEDENGENNDNDETQKRKKKKKKKEKKRKREEGESEENDLKEDRPVKKAKKKKKMKKKEKEKEKAKCEQDEMDVDFGAIEKKGANESNQMNEDIATRVFVGGIPYYSTEDDIRSFFESCGTITEVYCMQFPDSGKFRGIAIISFKTQGAAKRALDLDGADMGGFYLKIKPYKTNRTNKVPDFAPRIVEGYNRIYVGNLPWDITEDDLRKFFSDCNVSSIRFGMDKETGEFRGYAHVDFSDDISLMMSLKLDQQILKGRPIKISCAIPKNNAKVHQTTVHTSDNTHSAVPNNRVEVHLNTVSTSDGTDSGAVSSSSGKIKRRTCYECGEKGHISTDCPKKQTAGPSNSNTI